VARRQSAEPPGVGRRLVRSGRLAAASRCVAARLLQRRQQAHLRRPSGNEDADEGSGRSTAPPRPTRVRKTSPPSVRPPCSTRYGWPLALSRLHWVEPKLVAEITYLTWTADNLSRHGLWCAARGQAGRSGAERSRTGFIGRSGHRLDQPATVPESTSSGHCRLRCECRN
jgi:hypothetical protein